MGIILAIFCINLMCVQPRPQVEKLMLQELMAGKKIPWWAAEAGRAFGGQQWNFQLRPFEGLQAPGTKELRDSCGISELLSVAACSAGII